MQTYADLLGMQQEDIQQALADLKTQAKALLTREDGDDAPRGEADSAAAQAA